MWPMNLLCEILFQDIDLSVGHELVSKIVKIKDLHLSNDPGLACNGNFKYKIRANQ